MQVYAPRPQAEIMSHYVLWLHNVERKKRENKEREEEIKINFLKH